MKSNQSAKTNRWKRTPAGVYELTRNAGAARRAVVFRWPEWQLPIALVGLEMLLDYPYKSGLTYALTEAKRAAEEALGLEADHA